MATRWYMNPTFPDFIPTNYRGAWDVTSLSSGANKWTGSLDNSKATFWARHPAVTGEVTHFGKEQRLRTHLEFVSTNPWRICMFRAVSMPLHAQTISGTVDMCFNRNGADAMNAYTALHIYVTEGNTDTVRGTLLSNYAENSGAGDEWFTNQSLWYALFAPQSLSSLAISAGDRIVIEFGCYARNTSTANLSSGVYVGSDQDREGDIMLDGVPGQTEWRTSVGWIEFSDDITFDIPDIRVTQFALEVAFTPGDIGEAETELPNPCAPEYTEESENPTGDAASGSGETYLDYWQVGYDGLGSFPPIRTLILTQNWARGATITLAEGAAAFASTYSSSRLVDGSLATAFRLLTRAGMIILDVGSAVTPDIFAVLSHNLYAPMVVAAIGSNNSDMSSPVVTAGFNARHPVAFVDLRGYSFAPARYWALDIPFRYGVRGAGIGEIVLGPVDEFQGTIEPNFPITPRRWEVAGHTEVGTAIRYPTGTAQRTCNLSVRMTVEDEAVLRAAMVEVGTTDKRLLVVPSSRMHEAIWADSIPRYQRQRPNSREFTATLDLLEETLGAV